MILVCHLSSSIGDKGNCDELPALMLDAVPRSGGGGGGDRRLAFQVQI
jgi:hypothetical protein